MGERAVVIGGGPLSPGDDGFGHIALAALRRDWEVPRDVSLADVDTGQSARILSALQGAAAFVLLDAIDAGAPPGTSLVLDRDALPHYLSHRLNLPLSDVMGTLPGRAVAIGVQPTALHAGALSPEVEAAVLPAVWQTVAQLTTWGYDVHPRPGAGGRRVAA